MGFWGFGVMITLNLFSGTSREARPVPGNFSCFHKEDFATPAEATAFAAAETEDE